MKPVMNLDEVQFDDVEEDGFYRRRWAHLKGVKSCRT